MTPASISLSTCEMMNSSFSLLCLRRTCLTGLASLTASLCSITSLDTPGNPEASHVKTSELSRREVTSVYYYLLVRRAPMVMDRLPSEVSATFLVIFGSSLKCAGLGEADVEPPGLSSSPENATASASYTPCRSPAVTAMVRFNF